MSSNGLNQRLIRWSIEEIRHGTLWPISLALVLIIASIFSLAALADRMEQVMVKQGKAALMADTVYVSANPIPQALVSAVRQQERLQSAQMTRFATMAFSDEAMQLITVKAVDSAFPLLGSLQLQGAQGAQFEVNPGELWLDERIVSQLGVETGQSITLGDADLVVTGVIAAEPGLSFNPFQQMPAAYIHVSDLAATNAIQPGSRVQYRYYLLGDDNALAEAKALVELTPSDEWRDQDAASRSSEIFERTNQYLSLSVAIVILMAATTLVLTCHNYVLSRQQTIAMLKSIGASRRWIARWLLIQLGLLFVIASVVGVVIGMGLEVALRIPIKGLLPDPLPSYGVTPLILSLTSAILIAIPALGIPLSRLLSISAANAMQASATVSVSRRRYLLILVPFVPLIVAYYNNLMVWIVLGAIAALFVVLALVGTLSGRALRHLPLGTHFILAVSRINRSGLGTALQLGALSLSLMLLAIIWLVRTDLLADWQRTLPVDAPNVFSVNIADYELERYLQTLDEQGLARSPAFPLIRGRLSEINGRSINEISLSDDGRHDIDRELNLTWRDILPSYNVELEGQWGKPHSVSVEQSIAEDLGVTLGDELTFVISGQAYSANVISIRQVEWREMKPNFYFIFSPDVLAALPSSYFVSFRAEDTQQDVLNQLARQHPTVSMLDTRVMGAKIQSLVEQLVASITILAILGVVAGVLLIFTLLRLSLSQRQQELRLYRALGASRKRIRATIWAEFGILAVIAAFLAILAAEIAVGGIMVFGFDLTASLHPMLWIALPLIALTTLMLVVASVIKQLLVPINNSFG
ncbi:FtsX-like permease family protein [Vibrio sp. SM6]|uniref:FtsX-like permease family protein n=1 Tax=Vibrio agarilyticus TaxID=2726741 RepID=A0A7X8TR31_9VIBR|nr:FtsX-like permease family protein [Vibrio agarilyticus]NLS13325.1 FtsX-like permease family protein [Vibrio agarilyticus]